MKTFRNSRINLLILLVYLITLQVSTGSAFYSICISVAHGMTVIAEQLPRSNQKPQISLRKHLNINNNNKSSNFAACITPGCFSHLLVTGFTLLKITDEIISHDLIALTKLKDRAPPQ